MAVNGEQQQDCLSKNMPCSAAALISSTHQVPSAKGDSAGTPSAIHGKVRTPSSSPLTPSKKSTASDDLASSAATNSSLSPTSPKLENHQQHSIMIPPPRAVVLPPFAPQVPVQTM